MALRLRRRGHDQFGPPADVIGLADGGIDPGSAMLLATMVVQGLVEPPNLPVDRVVNRGYGGTVRALDVKDLEHAQAIGRIAIPQQRAPDGGRHQH